MIEISDDDDDDKREEIRKLMEKKRENARLRKKKHSAKETPEEREARCERLRMMRHEKIKSETELEKELKRVKSKVLMRHKRVEENEAERELKLEKARIYMRDKLFNETDEQRAIRFERVRKYNHMRREQKLNGNKVTDLVKVRTQYEIVKDVINLNEQRQTKSHFEKNSDGKLYTDNSTFGLTLSDLKLLEEESKKLLSSMHKNFNTDEDVKIDELSQNSVKREPSVEIDKDGTDLPINFNSTRLYCCLQCPLTFAFPSALIVHELEHKPKIKCLICLQNVFEDRLKDHIKSHYKPRKYTCRTCFQSFIGKNTLMLHQKEHKIARNESNINSPLKENQGIDKSNEFKCAHCHQKFALKLRLIDHLFRDHIGAAKEKCKKCEFSSHSKELMEAHALTHIPRYLMKCDLCKIQYKIPAQIKQHLQEVHGCFGKFYYNCDFRDIDEENLWKFELFTTLGDLEFTHNFECSMCFRKFMKKANLDYHIRHFHSDSFNFKCKKCDFSTKDTEEMKKHNSTVLHPIKSIKCDKCSKEFLHKAEFEEHFDLIHLGKLSHQCSLCGKEFMYKNALRNHLKYVHDSQTRYKCPFCINNDGYTYRFLKTEHNMRTHMKNLHEMNDINIVDYIYRPRLYVKKSKNE